MFGLFKEYQFTVKYKRTNRVYSRETVKVWFWQGRKKAKNKLDLGLGVYNTSKVSAKQLYSI